MPVPRIFEEVVEVIDAPVLQSQEEIAEAIQLIPAERVSERIVLKIVDASGPQFQEQTSEGVKITLVEQSVSATVPHVAAETS